MACFMTRSALLTFSITWAPGHVLWQGEFPHARKWVPARGLKEKTGHVIEILLDSVA